MKGRRYFDDRAELDAFVTYPPPRQGAKGQFVSAPPPHEDLHGGAFSGMAATL